MGRVFRTRTPVLADEKRSPVDNGVGAGESCVGLQAHGSAHRLAMTQSRWALLEPVRPRPFGYIAHALAHRPTGTLEVYP
jgi:hypothetical protein